MKLLFLLRHTYWLQTRMSLLGLVLHRILILPYLKFHYPLLPIVMILSWLLDPTGLTPHLIFQSSWCPRAQVGCISFEMVWCALWGVLPSLQLRYCSNCSETALRLRFSTALRDCLEAGSFALMCDEGHSISVWDYLELPQFTGVGSWAWRWNHCGACCLKNRLTVRLLSAGGGVRALGSR